MNILLIDDHPLLAVGIADLLRLSRFLVATVRSISEAREALARAPYDICLLDINLGAENGMDLLAERKLLGNARVVLLSGMTEQEWIFRGFELGAFAFISKSIEAEQLPAALHALAALPPAAAGSGWIWDAKRGEAVDAYDYFPRETILTPKEREVFLLMKEGKLDKQIAAELGLSVHTVRVHVRAIKRKRGHNRRYEQSL